MPDADMLKILFAACGSMAAIICGLIKWMFDRQMKWLEAIDQSIQQLREDKADNTELQRAIGRIEGATARAHERIDEMLSGGA